MAVAVLHFTCPNTNRRAPTGVEMDAQSLRAHWRSTLRCDCPHCDDVHDISVRDVYLNGAVDNLHRLMRA
jgi:hypothetical protein